jgi:DNA-binding NarL/FixJ family response regulator
VRPAAEGRAASRSHSPHRAGTLAAEETIRIPAKATARWRPRIAEGRSNKEIAAALVVTLGTAANHVQHILNKLGLHSRSQIAAWAAGHGLRPGRDAVGGRRKDV